MEDSASLPKNSRVHIKRCLTTSCLNEVFLHISIAKNYKKHVTVPVLSVKIRAHYALAFKHILSIPILISRFLRFLRLRTTMINVGRVIVNGIFQGCVPNPILFNFTPLQNLQTTSISTSTLMTFCLIPKVIQLQCSP